MASLGRMEYSTADAATGVSPAVQAAVDALEPILESIANAFRKQDRLSVLQQYDVMTYSPEVQDIAEWVLGVRPECQVLEAAENSINVLSPTFVTERVQWLAKNCDLPAGRTVVRGAGGVTSAVGSTANSTGVSPASLPAGTAARFNASPAPALATHSVIAEAHTAQAGVSPTARTLYATERRLEHAWALGLLTAQEQSPDEEDHHLEMLEEFEIKFSRPSELLRAVRGVSHSAQQVCEVYCANEGNITPDVLLGALLKHQPQTTTEIADFVAFVRDNEVHVTMQVAEVLEKSYVKCMVQEGAEVVFNRMTQQVGLVPLTTRPFAMLFNSKKFTMVGSVLDYYELMLDYGIAPEPSVLRILCKQSSGMEYASLHFTLRLKSYEQQQQQLAEKTAAGIDTKHADSSASASQQGASAAAAAAVAAAGAPTPAAPDSRRKNERAYFEKRLEDLADANPDACLMEAMKVVHRAEVEGTSLEGDSLLLVAILKLFCNGTTPVADLVHPLSASAAYRPGRITPLSREALLASRKDSSDGEGRRRGGAAALPRLREDNAFDFGLDGAQLEGLNDLEDDARKGPAGATGFFGDLNDDADDGALLEDADAGIDDNENLEELAHARILRDEGSAGIRRARPGAATGAEDDDDDDDDDGDGDLDDDSDVGDEDELGYRRTEDGGANTTDKSGAGASTASRARGAGAATREDMADRSHRTPRHVPGIASPGEEAAYVLDVFAAYGSIPDNQTLAVLSQQYIKRARNGIGALQQVVEALFRAGHESHGKVEAIKSFYCMGLVRYYIRRHQRGKLMHLVHSIVEQFYEYNHVFRSPLAAAERTSSCYLRYTTSDAAFLTTAMKMGPLDWALGLFAISLYMSPYAIAEHTQTRLIQLRDTESHRSPHGEVVNLLERCGWSRDHILACDAIMVDQADVQLQQDAKAGGIDGDGATDIFTASSQEAQTMSSHSNPRGLTGHATLPSYMHSVLREMNVSRGVLDYFKRGLWAERDAALAKLKASAGAGATESLGHPTGTPGRRSGNRGGGANSGAPAGGAHSGVSAAPTVTVGASGGVRTHRQDSQPHSDKSQSHGASQTSPPQGSQAAAGQTPSSSQTQSSPQQQQQSASQPHQAKEHRRHRPRSGGNGKR